MNDLSPLDWDADPRAKAPLERCPVRLIIWDCDGVLIDSEKIAARVHSRFLQRLGLQVSSAEILRGFSGSSDRDLRRAFERMLGQKLPDSYEQWVQREIVRVYRSGLQPTSGIADLLAWLSRSRMQMCVASNSAPEKLSAGIASAGLASWFGPNIFSASQVEEGKPAPDLFLLAAGSLGIDPKVCLVIEDSPFGVRAAVAAGMRAIGFLGSRQSPGHRVALSQAGACDLVEDAEALRRALEAAGVGR